MIHTAGRRSTSPMPLKEIRSLSSILSSLTVRNARTPIRMVSTE